MSVEQYHAMIDAGILGSDTPVELVEGILLQKMAKNPPHSIATQETRTGISKVVPPGWYVAVQEPITLTDSEPEPDVMVVRGKVRDYRTRYPGAADLALVVEVADTSIGRDRSVKMRMYARARIPFYWILDLNTNRVEVLSDPDGSTYRVLTVYTRNDAVPVIIDGIEAGKIPAAGILPD
jgi:Uma2 family endonuclease